MKLIALKIGSGIAALVLLAMVGSIARHRARSASPTGPGALGEYLWASIPWLMIILCAIPAVRQVVANDREPREVHALLSKMPVVIDEQKRE